MPFAPSPDPSARKPELPALMGVRFYFALFVFLSHVTVLPGMERISENSLLFHAGVAGVSCFFVLSGFILTYNYAAAFGSGVSAAAYRKFVTGRWTRIYPVHLLTLLLALPIQIFSPHLPLDWHAVPFHLLLMQCWWPFREPAVHNYLNVPSWSINCEWFFYLLAPFAIFLAARPRRRRWLFLVPLLYAAALGWFLRQGQSDWTRLYLLSWFAPSRLPEFLAGVLVAQGYLTRPRPASALPSCFLQVAGIGLIVAGAVCRQGAPWPLRGGLLYIPGAALLVPGLAWGRGVLAAHLSGPRVLRLGMASFSLYMLQAPVLRATRGVCLRLGWEVASPAAFCGTVLLAFSAVQGLAFLLHGYYEIPLQKLLRGAGAPSPGRAARALVPGFAGRSG